MLYGKQSRLNVKEAVWHVQQDRRGFEWNQTKWWPRCDEWGRRGLATQEILDMKEVRITRVVGQPYQDASNCLWGPKEYWTNPRGLQHSRISMLLRSVYDLLPTPVNLKWKVADSSAQCSQCGTHGTLEHILSSCATSLSKYTWRQNQDLKVIAVAAQKQYKDQIQDTEVQAIQFLASGGKPQQTTKSRTRLLLVSSMGSWKMMVDLGHPLVFPAHNAVTRLRPDMILLSDQERLFIIIELTVPWEGNISWVRERNMANY